MISDIDRLRRFRQYGAPAARPGQFGAADVQVTATLQASGIRWRGEPPSAAALWYQRQRLPAGDPQRLGPTLDELIAAAETYERLTAQRGKAR